MKNIISIFIAFAAIFLLFYFGSKMKIFEKGTENEIKKEAVFQNDVKKTKKEETKKEEKSLDKIKIEILKEGEGRKAENGDKITVHYIGFLENGTKFDSSRDRGKPFVFVLGMGKVIKGWEEGIIGMKTGEKRKLTIPPKFGYGKAGIPGLIPPNAVLIFEVELLDIESPKGNN